MVLPLKRAMRPSPLNSPRHPVLWTPINTRNGRAWADPLAALCRAHRDRTVNMTYIDPCEVSPNHYREQIPDGHVMYHEAWTHTVENIGDTDVLAIIYEPHP